MGMTIDMAIAIIENPTDYFPKDIEEVKHFMIDTMHKYQKIMQIANDKNINGDLLRMSEIRWVLEDGKID